MPPALVSLALAVSALLGGAVAAAEGADPGLPPAISTGGIIVVLVGMFTLLLTGKLRMEREVREANERADKADTEATAWKAAYEIEVEARQAAEAAARHIMDSGSVSVALVEALRSVSQGRPVAPPGGQT